MEVAYYNLEQHLRVFLESSRNLQYLVGSFQHIEGVGDFCSGKWFSGFLTRTKASGSF